MVELGLQDGTKAYVKTVSGRAPLKEGKPISLVAIKVKKKSKIVIAEDLRSEKGRERELVANEGLTFEMLRPGCLVKCTVTTKYDSGVEVSFLGHFTGHIFIDHLRRSPKEYRRKDPIMARIISIK